ncbi:hypothetical protein [Curvivirga sp.]
MAIHANVITILFALKDIDLDLVLNWHVLILGGSGVDRKGE